MKRKNLTAIVMSICPLNGIQIDNTCLEPMNENIPFYQQFDYMGCIALYTDMFMECDDMNIQELLCSFEYCDNRFYGDGK